MVYLCIKEMATISEDVIIVTSSLTKDMTGKVRQFYNAMITTIYKQKTKKVGRKCEDTVLRYDGIE